MVDTRKTLLLVVVLMLALSIMSGALLAAPASEGENLVSQLQAHSDGKVLVHTDDVTGFASYVEAGQGVLTREFADKGSPEEIARAFLGSYGGLFGLTD